MTTPADDLLAALRPAATDWLAPLLAQAAAAPQPATIGVVNFTDAGPGLLLGTTFGRGTALDTYALLAGSSDKGPRVPTLPGSTNPYVVLSSPKGADTVIWSGFTVLGADVGHPYHLARIDTARFAYVAGCVFAGGAGYAPGPPGETRTLALPSCAEAVVEDCLVDGLGAAADGIGAPYCGRLTYRRVTVRGVQFWGAAWYQPAEVLSEGLNLTGGRGANHEQVRLSRHTGLVVNLPAEPQPHAKPPTHLGMHATYNGPPGDHVWDFAGWTGGLYGDSSPLCIRRSTIYPDGVVQDLCDPPRITRNGVPLFVADAGREADKDGRYKAIAKSGLDRAFADWQNSVIVHH